MIKGIPLLALLLCLFAAFCSSVSAETFHRWVDEKGVTHMTNRPLDELQPENGKAGNVPEKSTGASSASGIFVAKSSMWVKPGIKNLYTTIEIHPLADRTYRVKTICEREPRPFSSLEPDEVLFFSFCVFGHFASLKGFNGWKFLEEENKKHNKRGGNNEIEYSIALVKTGSRSSANMRERCSKFIRPEYLWDDVEVTVDTNKPVCRKLVRLLADGELNARKKAYDKNNRSNIFEFSVDVDGDGRKDRITETITGERTHLSVKLATGKGYTLDEDGYVSLVNLNGKEHALVNYVKWDRDRKRGHTTGRRLYELTKDKPKLVCDREDLKELLQ